MSEKQLALAAALAGVATVDLGGAGAGRHLQSNMAHPDVEDALGDGLPGEIVPTRDSATDDVWRRILFQAPRFTADDSQ